MSRPGYNIFVSGDDGSGRLTAIKEEIKKMAEIALEVKPDFIKTSTGFGTSGAKVEDVELMKSVVGDEIGVKAAGGIRSLKEAQNMINAGATRIGTSKGVEIIQEMK